MTSNWVYYCFTLLSTIFILSSCLNSDSDEIDYSISRDAQITSLSISSREDSLRVLSKVKFSIDQVSSAPIIFNKDSLPYLFDISNALLQIKTNNASGIKLHLFNPDSSYIWNQTDSVMIKKLKHIEIFAEDGVSTKRYTFKLNTHQQDPDTIFWQNVAENYISPPTDQVTVSNEDSFFTYYKVNNSIRLSTSPIDNGEDWTAIQIDGLPANVILKSIQNDSFENGEIWYALDDSNNVYESNNGESWSMLTTTYPVKAIFGRLPSFTEDRILTIVEDEGAYKFAMTKDFTSINANIDIPEGFPIKDFTSTTINKPNIHTAKYLIVTGGKDVNDIYNKKIWLLQEDDGNITLTSELLKFYVKGSTLFEYDDKVYLLTSENNKNVFYTSNNYGAFWKKASNKQSLPLDFTIRENQSVNVDDKNNIWIFGGQSTNQNQLVDVWKGRINKLFTE